MIPDMYTLYIIIYVYCILMNVIRDKKDICNVYIKIGVNKSIKIGVNKSIKIGVYPNTSPRTQKYRPDTTPNKNTKENRN